MNVFVEREKKKMELQITSKYQILGCYHNKHEKIKSNGQNDVKMKYNKNLMKVLMIVSTRVSSYMTAMRNDNRRKKNQNYFVSRKSVT